MTLASVRDVVTAGVAADGAEKKKNSSCSCLRSCRSVEDLVHMSIIRHYMKMIKAMMILAMIDRFIMLVAP